MGGGPGPSPLGRTASLVPEARRESSAAVVSQLLEKVRRQSSMSSTGASGIASAVTGILHAPAPRHASIVSEAGNTFIFKVGTAQSQGDGAVFAGAVRMSA